MENYKAIAKLIFYNIIWENLNAIHIGINIEIRTELSFTMAILITLIQFQHLLIY